MLEYIFAGLIGAFGVAVLGIVDQILFRQERPDGVSLVMCVMFALCALMCFMYSGALIFG